MARLESAGEIERLLARGGVFRIDQINCMNHAQVIRGFQRHVHVTPWHAFSKKEQLAFKLAFVAVCHQFNWDYLQQKIYEYLLESRVDLAAQLRTTTAADVDQLLLGHPDSARFRSKERARLLRDVGEVLEESYRGSIEALYEDCDGSSLRGGGFYRVLDQFEAYRTDPLRKKSNVLSHDLFHEGVVTFMDSENMEPAVDYHLMRIYLRTGRVVAASDAVSSFLRGSPNPRGALVRELRAAVSEAAKLTASYAGLNVADLNFLEWQIGRSICANVEPRCDSTDFVKPIADDVNALCAGGCPYRSVCVARNELHSFMLLEEPRFESSAY